MREKGYISFIQKSAEALENLSDLVLKSFLECLRVNMIFVELSNVRNIHLNKLDEFLSHKTDITFQAIDYCRDEIFIFEYDFTLFLLFH